MSAKDIGAIVKCSSGLNMTHVPECCGIWNRKHRWFLNQAKISCSGCCKFNCNLPWSDVSTEKIVVRFVAGLWSYLMFWRSLAWWDRWLKAINKENNVVSHDQQRQNGSNWSKILILCEPSRLLTPQESRTGAGSRSESSCASLAFIVVVVVPDNSAGLVLPGGRPDLRTGRWEISTIQVAILFKILTIQWN